MDFKKIMRSSNNEHNIVDAVNQLFNKQKPYNTKKYSLYKAPNLNQVTKSNP